MSDTLRYTWSPPRQTKPKNYRFERQCSKMGYFWSWGFSWKKAKGKFTRIDALRETGGSCQFFSFQGKSPQIQKYNFRDPTCESAMFGWLPCAGSKIRVLPEDYCKKDPCNFSTEVFVSWVGNPCQTIYWSASSEPDFVLSFSVGEKQHEIARARLCTQSCLKVGQLLVTSSPTPHPIVLCQHPRDTWKTEAQC